MHIYGPSQLHGSQPIGAPHSLRLSQPAAAPRRHRLPTRSIFPRPPASPSRSVNCPNVREERVEAVRLQIAEGTYETSDRLNAAIERLLDEIG